MDASSELWVVANAGLAMLLGGAIGYERELKDRPAGFRTHMLVSGAAALLIGIGRIAFQAQGAWEDAAIFRVDPLRLVEAVVAGVSFIGAGTIFARRSDGAIAGITTAASLLMVAVIGVACGMSLYLVAGASALLALLVLTLLRTMER